MMICDPNQSRYIEEGTTSLRVCRDSCEKLFNACGLPGENYDSFMEYVDPVSMCQELWHGRAFDERHDCNHGNNYVCASELQIKIVESDCLSMLDPHASLVGYHDQPFVSTDHSRSSSNVYPNGCTAPVLRLATPTTRANSTLKSLGIVVLCIVILICLCYAIFIVYYFWPEERIRAMTFAMQEKETEDDEHLELIESLTQCNELGVILEEPPLVDNDSSSSSSAPIKECASTKKIVRSGRSFKKARDSKPMTTSELSFLQQLDLRELKDQNDLGYITNDDYDARRNEILNNRYV
jgi:hypothetical protein